MASLIVSSIHLRYVGSLTWAYLQKQPHKHYGTLLLFDLCACHTLLQAPAEVAEAFASALKSVKEQRAAAKAEAGGQEGGAGGGLPLPPGVKVCPRFYDEHYGVIQRLICCSASGVPQLFSCWLCAFPFPWPFLRCAGAALLTRSGCSMTCCLPFYSSVFDCLIDCLSDYLTVCQVEEPHALMAPGSKPGQQKFIQESGGAVVVYTWDAQAWQVGAQAAFTHIIIIQCHPETVRPCCVLFMSSAASQGSAAVPCNHHL